MTLYVCVLVSKLTLAARVWRCSRDSNPQPPDLVNRSLARYHCASRAEFAVENFNLYILSNSNFKTLPAMSGLRSGD
jgi:hypothetical protein